MGGGAVTTFRAITITISIFRINLTVRLFYESQFSAIWNLVPPVGISKVFVFSPRRTLTCSKSGIVIQ